MVRQRARAPFALFRMLVNEQAAAALQDGNPVLIKEGQIEDVCQTTIPANETSTADARGRGDAGGQRPGGQRRGIALAGGDAGAM